LNGHDELAEQVKKSAKDPRRPLEER